MRVPYSDRVYDLIIHMRKDAKGRDVPRFQLVNPARQAKKRSGLSGHQWKKRQKAARR